MRSWEMPAEESALTSGVLFKETRSRRLATNLRTPDNIRTFQRKLYLKAKAEAAQGAFSGHPSVPFRKGLWRAGCAVAKADEICRPGVCLEVKSVGKPHAVAPHVRFDEWGWETESWATAPILDSTQERQVVKTLAFAV